MAHKDNILSKRKERIAFLNRQFQELCKGSEEETRLYDRIDLLSPLLFSPTEVSFVPDTWKFLPFREKTHFKEGYPALLKEVWVFYKENFSKTPFLYKGTIFVEFLFENPVFNHVVPFEAIHFEEKTLLVIEHDVLITFGIVFPNKEIRYQIEEFFTKVKSSLEESPTTG